MEYFLFQRICKRKSSLVLFLKIALVSSLFFSVLQTNAVDNSVKKKSVHVERSLIDTTFETQEEDAQFSFRGSRLTILLSIFSAFLLELVDTFLSIEIYFLKPLGPPFLSKMLVHCLNLPPPSL